MPTSEPVDARLEDLHPVTRPLLVANGTNKKSSAIEGGVELDGAEKSLYRHCYLLAF